MKTKIIYVLVSNENDCYLEQALVSIYSLRLYNPDANLLLLVDEETSRTLENGIRKLILNYVSKLVIVDVPFHYSKQQKSRYIKTSLRSQVIGDFLFMSLQTMMGWQYGKGKGLEVAAFGVERHSSWVKLCLDSYDKRPFVLPDGSFDILQPLPLQVEKTLLNNGYDLISVTSLEDAMKIDEASMKIAIFPATFFSPKSFTDGVIRTTTNTYSIHHFAASWLPFYTRWEIKFWHLLRLPNFRILHFIGQLLKKVHLKK